MHRKVMVACLGIAALLIFARLTGSGGASGNSGAGRPAAAAPAVAQIAALPVAAAQAVPGSGSLASSRNKAAPAAPPETALDLLAGFTPAGAAATATAAAAVAPAARAAAAQAAEPAAIPASADDRKAAEAAATSGDRKAGEAAALTPAGNPDAPKTLNDVPLDAIVVLPPDALNHARQIYALGQAKGRNPHAFSKIGDSTMAFPPLLAAFDNPAGYRLGPYAYLSSTIERFAGSLGRESAAVKKGMHTWTEFDAAWVNSNQCQSGEGPLACELRLNNPSIAVIRLGTNDYNVPEQYREALLQIVDYCLTRGVVPVLGTKPDRLEGPQNTINQIVYEVAADYDLPLWDYDRVATTVPGKGLMSDGTHYLNNGSRDFGSKAAFTRADSLEDLSALMMLDALGRELK